MTKTYKNSENILLDPQKKQVLNAGDDMVGLEQLEEDSDEKALLKARHLTGSMSAFSGAGGMVFMEDR
jgi:DNA excision repair protein ERCC-3